MKKLYPIFIVGILILGSIGASATSIFNIEKRHVWSNIEIPKISGNDELDQSQLEMDFFAPVGNIFLAPEINYISAQSFIPTKNILTRVEILTGKNSSATHDFTLAIRDDLPGYDITKLSLPPEDFVTENFSWLEFDFDDISVTPGITYYIVCYTADEPDNWYAWGAQLSDVYPNGTVWWSEDDGTSWEEDQDADLTFKTYGFDNSPPEGALLDGPTYGKVGTAYEYSMIANDPDGHTLIYCFDFGDESGEVCIGPFPNGETGYLSHTYTTAGTYTITAKASDIYGAEGEPVTLEVTMPRSRTISSFFYWIQQSYPKAYLIFQKLLGF